MKKRWPWFLLGLIFLGALGVRLSPGLYQRDYWYDEAFTGILLRQPWGKMNQMIFADVHPPLYYWLAKPWAAIFHYSSAGIRSFSLVFGMLTVLSLYWIGVRMFNRRAGLLAAILAAFSPFAIQYSQEARMYALFGFLMLWAVWFFYQALQTNRLKYWILWGVFGGLSFYTHYLSLFFFVIFYVAFVADHLLLKRDNNQQGERGWRILWSKNFWLGAGVITIFFLSWIKIFIQHISKGNLGWIGSSYLSDIPKTLQIFFFGHPPGTGGVPTSNEFKFFFDSSSAGLLILSFILVLMVVAWAKGKKKRETMLLATISFGTLLLLIFLSQEFTISWGEKKMALSVKLYVARYFMPAAVLVYLLLAGLVTTVFQNKRAGWLGVLGAYAIMLFLLKPIPITTKWNQLYQLRQSLLGGKTLIITAGPFDYSTARFYFGKERVRFFNKSNPQEDFSGWVVVGNQPRINSVETVNQMSAAVIVDQDCAWSGLNVKEKIDLGELSICQVGK